MTDKEDNNGSKICKNDGSAPITFEETIKRLLQLPPKKQSEIKGKKKDK